MIHKYSEDYDDMEDLMDDDDEDIPFDGLEEYEAAHMANGEPVDSRVFSVTFDDVCGYDDVKAVLRTICGMAKNMGSYMRMGIRMPHGVLLYGRPGLGKTMMAKAMAREIGHPVYMLSKVQAYGAFMALIRETFAEAKNNAPAVILLDDLDKFSQGRGRMDEFSAVQAGIDSVLGSDVLVIATANNINCLPDSLLRHGRFDRKIYISYPSTEESAAIIGKCLAGKPVSKSVNLETVAKLLYGYACASLDSVINEAGIEAVTAGKSEIETEDIVKAVLTDIYDVDNTGVMSPEQKAQAAYHEAGHAAAVLLFWPGSVCIASVCSTAKEGPQGFVQTMHHESSYENSVREITCALAGRAAMEIKYGIPDNGAVDDIRKAMFRSTNLVQRACAKGLQFTELVHSEESDNTLRMRNTEVVRLMEDCYQQAKSLLTRNWALVEAIAQGLIRKDTLICEDLDAICADCLPGHNAAGDSTQKAA